MIRAAACFLLSALAFACSTSPEPEPRFEMTHAKTPVTYGRTVQALFALRLVKAHSDPLQSAQLAATAHLISAWYDLPPFDEATGAEEAYLRGFCRDAGWDAPDTRACFERICRTVLLQLETALHRFRALPNHDSGVDELLLDVEALKLELDFPPLAILALGDERPDLAFAQRRRLPPGLPLVVSAEHFRVFESSAIPWTQVDRIREILERAAGLEEPAAVSLFAGTREPTSQVLFLLTLARTAGVRRVWAWGRHDGLAAAVALELVPELPPEQDSGVEDPMDLTSHPTWGEALAAASKKVRDLHPVMVRVGAPPPPPEPDPSLPNLPALERIRDKLSSPEP
jgi:hypothetical protein